MATLPFPPPDPAAPDIVIPTNSVDDPASVGARPWQQGRARPYRAIYDVAGRLIGTMDTATLATLAVAAVNALHAAPAAAIFSAPAAHSAAPPRFSVFFQVTGRTATAGAATQLKCSPTPTSLRPAKTVSPVSPASKTPRRRRRYLHLGPKSESPDSPARGGATSKPQQQKRC